MDQPTAEEALRALEPLVGRWAMTARWPDGQPWPGTAWMSFEWDASGALLLQRSGADLPEAPGTTSVIGCDAAAGRYVQLYTDDRGVSRVYEMSMAGDEWRLWRDGAPFAQRFVGRLSDDGLRIHGRWEIDEDGQGFRTDFDIVLTRADG